MKYAKTLYDTDIHEFLRFVLSGEVASEHQAVIDPFHNILKPGFYVDSMHDYDSVIGITEDIVVLSGISVYPIPNPSEVLTTSIHLTYGITNGNVC